MQVPSYKALMKSNSTKYFSLIANNKIQVTEKNKGLAKNSTRTRRIYFISKNLNSEKA